MNHPYTIQELCNVKLMIMWRSGEDCQVTKYNVDFINYKYINEKNNIQFEK